MAMPWLRWLIGGLSPDMPKFNARPIHVGFVVESGPGTGFCGGEWPWDRFLWWTVALGQVFPRVLQFFSISIILTVLHVHLLIHSYIQLSQSLQNLRN
jgi:hypothetical protein